MTYDVRSLRPRRGFTLVEVVVVMALFTVVAEVAMGIFIFTSRVQRRTRALLEASAEARAAADMISREVRADVIDYSFYAEQEPPVSLGQQQPLAALALVTEVGQLLRYRCVESEAASPCAVGGERGRLEVCKVTPTPPVPRPTCGANDWAPLVGDALDVTGWRVWLGPTSTPFEVSSTAPGTYGSNQQPWVTAVIEMQPRPVAGQTLQPVRVQATAVTRTYVR
jgi:prepilin-type N-terminal cleavage/methylation domain-containing protein